MPQQHPGPAALCRRWLIAVVAAAAYVAATGTGIAAAPPQVDDPPEFQMASETEVPGEADYWLSLFECPEFDGVEPWEPSVTADGKRVTLSCSYDGADGRWVGNFSVDWQKPGQDVDSFCGYNSGDLGVTYRAADPLLAASAGHTLGRIPEARGQATAAVDAWFDVVVRQRAAPCAPDDAPECAPVDGWVREGFFGPQDAADYIDTDETAFAECGYTRPDPTAASEAELTTVSFEVTAFKPAATASDIQRACSTADRFRLGQGQRGTGGTHAVEATYITNSAEPLDMEPFTAAIDSMTDTLATESAPCDDVTLLPGDPFTPLPPFYAAVFDADAAETAAPPIVGSAAVSGAATAAQEGDAEPDAAPGATQEEADGTTAGAAAGETPGQVVAPAATDGSSSLAWVFTVITIVGLTLSVLMLGVTFWMVRKSSRVRPRWDLVRLAISASVAVAFIVVFSKSAPAWAAAGAVLLGGGLGYWQGTNLVVQLTDRGLFAKRSAWAIAAFTVGLVITQLARLLDRSGAITLGITLTLFSAALGAGVYLGRRPKIALARSAGAGAPASVVAIVVLVAMAFAAPTDRRADASELITQTDAQTDEEQDDGPDPAATEALSELIDWTSVTIEGGLFLETGKPLAELTVPVGLSEPPEPQSRTVDWVDDFNADISYSLEETYSFELRDDGQCCSVDYTATGEKVVGDVARPIEFDGRLDDIQLLAAEGVGITDPAGRYVDGMPFAEVRPVEVTSGVDCHRPIAETRAFDTLEETGGAGEIRVQETDSRVAPGLQVRVGTACELPGFTLDRALELAPPTPPADDPARQLRQVGNCPVYSEVVSELGATSVFGGASTHTLGTVIFDGNANACELGTLFAPPAIGQGGPGGVRHEFAMDLAQPRVGEWDRGYDRWWPDPEVIEPATITEPSTYDVCETDGQGVPIAPPGVEDGATCRLITQHEIPEGQIWIATNYDLSDGPDTEIRAELPWGAFFYRCHHCEPGDPNIIEFLDGLIAYGNGAAADITYTETFDADSFDDLVDANDADIDDAATGDDGAAAQGEGGGGATADPALADAEELVDLVTDDDASDAEREAALAAVIGLLGAAGIGASSLREAGVSTGEMWERWRTDGARGVDELFTERGAELAASVAVIDERGEVLRPGDDGLYEWDDGDSVRRVPRDELEELIARERSANAARQQRIDSLVSAHRDDDRAARELAELSARSRADDELARAQLAAELEAAGRADLTRQNVADLLAERAANGGWDAVAERLGDGDALTREELLEIGAVLDRLAQRQGAVDPASTGTFAGDLWDEFARDGAAAQEVVAQAADAQMGPLGGWMVRNPVAAGRIGAAVATGGFSEGLLTPLDVMDAMERAAERAHAEGRDLTHAEALAAAAWEVGPGMLFGHLAETGLTRYGSQLADAAQESFESAARSVDDWLEAGARVGDDAGAAVTREAGDAGSRWVGGTARERSLRSSALADEHGLHWVGKENLDGVEVRNLPDGTIVPQSRISSEYGMRPESYRQLRRAVERTGTGVEVRSASGRVPEILERGGVPKPESVKVKTANEFDRYMGLGDDVEATVPWRPDGWPRPEPDVVPDNFLRGQPDDVRLDAWRTEGYPGTKDRWEFRQAELANNADDMQRLLNGGDARVNASTGQLEMRNDAGGWGPVTGDHDIFRFQVEIPAGLSPEEAAAHLQRQKAEILAELKLPPFNAQHGAHIDWVPVKPKDVNIDTAIMGKHTAGRGDALLAVHPGRPAFVTYSSGSR